jgi:hypothetical protein
MLFAKRTPAGLSMLFDCSARHGTSAAFREGRSGVRTTAEGRCLGTHSKQPPRGLLREREGRGQRMKWSSVAMRSKSVLPSGRLDTFSFDTASRAFFVVCHARIKPLRCESGGRNYVDGHADALVRRGPLDCLSPYHQTLYRSARNVLQRPAADFDLEQAAPVVLTRIDRGTTTLGLPRSADTQYIVYGARLADDHG